MAGEWDISLPIDHTKIGDLPGEHRKITAKVETVIEKEHESLGDNNSGGQHSNGSAVAYEGTDAITDTPDGTTLANTAVDRGRLRLNDNFDPPVLERWSGTAWEVVGTIAAGASPNIAKLINTTAEDGAGERESRLAVKGTQSGGEETTLGYVEFSHYGSSDDQKGRCRIVLNSGDEDDAPSNMAIDYISTGKINVVTSLSVLDEDDMTSNDAEVLATQQSIKAYVDATPHTGGVVQIVNVQTGALTNCPTVIPDDDTIPQKTEGDEVMTLAITPTSATNKLLIEVVVNVSQESGLMATVALFQDATTGALACSMKDMGSANRIQTVSLTYYMTTGTTSETTFKIRVGSDAGDANVNGINTGRLGGGVMISSITITETQE